jgi:hypothetical protein
MYETSIKKTEMSVIKRKEDSFEVVDEQENEDNSPDVRMRGKVLDYNNTFN